MKRRRFSSLGTLSLIALLAVSGCASSDTPKATSDASVATSTPIATASPTTTTTATTPPPAASAEPVSDIDASVQVFVGALDELGIEHTDPVRAAVGGSGAKARFDITVDGFDAGINVFSDNETLVAWGEASDSFGGIYVAQGNAVLSLNSTEGVTDSAKIAPQISAAVGGEAHGI